MCDEDDDIQTQDDIIMFKICDSKKFVSILAEREYGFIVVTMYRSIFHLKYTYFIRL